MAVPQNFKNHARYHPPFHFFLIPLLLLNLAFVIHATIHQWPQDRGLNLWLIFVSIMLLLIAANGRASAMKAQDRVIRLEERLRLAALLPPADHHRINELSVRQLIALRFASDDELPALVHRTLEHGLDSKAIKKSIVNWRPDYHRV
ncbi:MAG: hypothetical protein JWM43_784 [Acidobacteriaceae bacterium]|nr:hypothetical protein [Acidobacteriaceae bacterium]